MIRRGVTSEPPEGLMDHEREEWLELVKTPGRVAELAVLFLNRLAANRQWAERMEKAQDSTAQALMAQRDRAHAEISRLESRIADFQAAAMLGDDPSSIEPRHIEDTMQAADHVLLHAKPAYVVMPVGNDTPLGTDYFVVPDVALATLRRKRGAQ